ncbi:TrmB family transcriptional regulator [bacterium SCSIO 12741]|nr:TrmB family transcriptional regulator [bacterium SCSIO 12741]
MKEVTRKLSELGFSEYESRTYQVLLNQDLLSASEIGKLAEVPQGRIYSVLQQLIDKGFCTLFQGAVKKYKAVHPKTAFNSLIHKQEQSYQELIQFKDQLAKDYEERQTDSTPLEYIQILTSKQSQVAKFDELILESKQTLYSFNKGPYATGFNRKLKEIDEASAPLKKIMAAGTVVRALFEREDKAVEPFVQMLEYYQSLGEEVKICPSLPMKMLLSDGNKAMVSLRNNDASRFKLTSMVVDHTDLTTALSELFELYWNQGITLEEYLQQVNYQPTE